MAAALVAAAIFPGLAIAAPERLRVVLVGDSTLAPRTGYGDAFCGLFKWPVECVNLGRGGRSTKSYRADGSWDKVAALLSDKSPRDTYVLVQFGHNDQPGKAERSTDVAAEYPANLARYAAEITRAGARPVLVTPLTRRQFRDGLHHDDLAPWAEAMRRVAREHDVPLLDLHADSVAVVSRMGSAKADALAELPPPSPRFDRTHVGPKGAALFARLLARRMAQVVPELANELVVGAIEPPGRVARPQLTAEQVAGYSRKAVLGNWEPTSTPLPAKADFTVDASGADGALRTVQAAINAALARAQSDRVHIRIRPGQYEGLVYVPASAPPMTIYSEAADASAVRIHARLDGTVSGAEFRRRFGAMLEGAPASVASMFETVARRRDVGTPGSAVAWIRAPDFTALNVTFENTHNKDRGDRTHQSQAVALLLDDADRVQLDNVRMLGFQDTFYLSATQPLRPARTFVRRSYVEGDMDFIFGEGTAYFVESEVRSLGDRAVSYTLAPSTHYLSPHGFVFARCRFTHDGTPNALAGTFKLARQWHRGPAAVGKVAILESEIGAHIDAERPWADWSIGTPRHRPVQYDAAEHRERLAAAGIDPQRDLGYPPPRSPPEPFLAEYQNTGAPP